MIRLLVVAVTGAAVVTACTGKDAVDQSAGGQYRFVSAQASGKVIAAADRKPTGPVTGTLLDGGTFRLADLKGKVVVVNFFASWCGPCQTEVPNFVALSREVKAQGVAFVGIDAKDTSKSAASAFVTDNAVSYPIVYDEKAKTAVELGDIPSASLPFTIVLDKQQRIAAVYVSALLPADLRPALSSLAAES
jgi:thiol-disulfide isomerase/thioredoxin